MTMAVPNPKYDHYDFPATARENKPGHAGHLTKEQAGAVEHLRTLLDAEGYTQRLDTLTLLRFLRARKFDIMLAKKMFMEDETWRKTFGGGVDQLVDTFSYTEKEKVFAYYPQYYHKTDKDGRPVYIESLGKVNLKEMHKITTDERMLQNLVVEYEKLADPRLPACSRKAGSLVETCCTIMDLKGVGLSNASQVYGYLQQASGISQNHYPERLGKLYLINAPWGFSAVFSVVKGFLDPVTVAKINILGGGYQSELLKQIPAENLPSEYGGKCTCPGGCQLSDDGPWRDPEWARSTRPETEANAGANNSIPATESHIGEGVPPPQVSGPAVTGEQLGQPVGQPAPAAQ